MSDSPNVVLDTSIIIELLRRKDLALGQKVAELVLSRRAILLCPVVFFEVERGLKPEAKRQRALFDGLQKIFEYREFDKAVWEGASKKWAALRHLRNKPMTGDFLIAAYAERHNAKMIARDRDFVRLAVPCEYWDSPGDSSLHQ